MSVRAGLLALLVERPRYGYELRSEFESRTGGAWPLNVGQVYTTLARLERDGCVTSVDAGPSDDESAQHYYAITDAGRAEVTEWFQTPVRRESRPRDELAIKLALAVACGAEVGIDVTAVVQAQRTDSLRALQDYTRLKARAGAHPADPAELAWSLVLDALVFQTEAEVRWLDHCEARVARAAREPRPAGPSSGTSAGPRGTAAAVPTATGGDRPGVTA